MRDEYVYTLSNFRIVILSRIVLYMSVYKSSQQIQSGQFTASLFFKARKVSAKREEIGWVGEQVERKKRDFLPSIPISVTPSLC